MAMEDEKQVDLERRRKAVGVVKPGMRINLEAERVKVLEAGVNIVTMRILTPGTMTDESMTQNLIVARRRNKGEDMLLVLCPVTVIFIIGNVTMWKTNQKLESRVSITVHNHLRWESLERETRTSRGGRKVCRWTAMVLPMVTWWQLYICGSLLKKWTLLLIGITNHRMQEIS
jgi:hypothetical protein